MGTIYESNLDFLWFCLNLPIPIGSVTPELALSQEFSLATGNHGGRDILDQPLHQ
ncbi:hypothetical protein DITRI_Ditri13aG0044400 [Diplodiscus trichospermus]